jgi:hypothetical protein
VHITVDCPRCGSRYHLDPSMRGQRMRCPNPLCREVFEVREAEPALPGMAPPPSLRPPEEFSFQDAGPAPIPDQAVEPPADPHGTGKVGVDIPLVPIEEEEEKPSVPVEEEDSGVIPVLPAELVSKPGRDRPREVRSWQEPPPVRRAGVQGPHSPEAVEVASASRQEPAAVGRRSDGTAFAPSDQPTESWQPSRAAAAPTVEPPPQPAGASRRRISSLAALIMALLAVGAIAGGTWFVVSHFALTEDKQLLQARGDYDQGSFASAAQKFGQLEKAFPNSANLGLYRFFAHLSEVRNAVYSLTEPREALTRLEGFLEAQKGSPLLTEYRVDLWETTHRLVDSLTDAARQDHSQELLAKASEVLTLARSFKPKDVIDDTRAEQAEAAIADVAAGIARREKRQALVAEAIATEPTP